VMKHPGRCRRVSRGTGWRRSGSQAISALPTHIAVAIPGCVGLSAQAGAVAEAAEASR
jgi:hypothetical protein